MGLKDNLVKDVVGEVIEQSDIAPGELNQKITRVMDVMDKSYDKFDDIQGLQEELVSSANGLQSASTQLAEVSVEMAKAAQRIAEASDEMGDNSQELQESIDELQDTMETLSEKIPEEDE